MKVCVMLAPPAALSNNSVAVINLMALKVNRIIIESLLNTVHLWNILPYDYLQSGVAGEVCKLFNGTFCNLVMKLNFDEDPTIDYTERYDVYLSNVPSGAGYKNYVHYGQLVDHNT